MTELVQFSAVAPTPTGVIRAVRHRLDALERDLAGVRAALATAEAELIAAKTDATPEPVALTTDQVAHMLGLSRSTVTAMIGRRELASIKARPRSLSRGGRRRRCSVSRSPDGRSSIHKRSDGAGKLMTGPDTTLSAYLDTWITARTAVVRPSTLAGYRTDRAHVARSGIGAVKLRALTPEHIERLYAAVLAYLGLREGEALGLRWADVDLDRGELRVRHALSWLPWRHGCDIAGAPTCGKRAACLARTRACSWPPWGGGRRWRWSSVTRTWTLIRLAGSRGGPRIVPR